MNELLRLKEAIKITLAIGIALYIPISLGWNRPYWAAVPIVLMAVEYSHSITMRAVLRLFGTMIGLLLLTTFYQLFEQQPTEYILCLGIWLAICVYFALGSSIFTVFLVLGVTALLGLDDISSPSTLFNLAGYRFVNTCVGAATYIVVSQCLWPYNGYKQISHDCKKLFKHIEQLLIDYESIKESSEKVKAHFTRIDALFDAYKTTVSSVKKEYGVQFSAPKTIGKLTLSINNIITSLKNTLHPDNIKDYEGDPPAPSLHTHPMMITEKIRLAPQRVGYALIHKTTRKDSDCSQHEENAQHRPASQKHTTCALSDLTESITLLEQEVCAKPALWKRLVPILHYPIVVDFTFSKYRLQRAISPLIVIIIAYGISYFKITSHQSSFIIFATLIASFISVTPHLSPFKVVFFFVLGLFLGEVISLSILPLTSSYWFLFSFCALVYFTVYLLILDIELLFIRIVFLLPFSLIIFYSPHLTTITLGNVADKLEQALVIIFSVSVALIPQLLFPKAYARKTT